MTTGDPPLDLWGRSITGGAVASRGTDIVAPTWTFAAGINTYYTSTDFGKPRIEFVEPFLSKGEPMRRLVQVWVIDPDPRLPAERAVIHQHGVYLTDDTDEEIKAGINLNELLKIHNGVREESLDEEETRKQGMRIYLPAVKLRDVVIYIQTIRAF